MGRFLVPSARETMIGADRWFEYGQGERVACPGSRSHPGRRFEARETDRRHADRCNRPIYNDVGLGLRVLVRVAFAGQTTSNERSPVTPRTGATIRYCRDCRSWIEILQLPRAG